VKWKKSKNERRLIQYHCNNQEIYATATPKFYAPQHFTKTIKGTCLIIAYSTHKERKVSLMNGKEFYRGEIIKMLKRIDSETILRYVYIIIDDIVKEKNL
jgi:hypothetical protein